MRLGVTGRRPKRLPGGYDLKQDPNRWIVGQMVHWIEKLEPEECCTGLALGSDMLFALACLKAGVPYTAFLPCSNQSVLWSPHDQKLHQGLRQRAANVVLVHDGPYHHGCMHDRNEAMISWLLKRVGSILTAVWDGDQDGGTWDTVRRARSVGLDIVSIDPADWTQP